MSLLKNKLRLMIPRLATEANQLKDSEARSRWMKLRSIALSMKSVTQSCSASGCSVDFFNKWGKRLVKGKRLKSLLSQSRKPYRSPNKTKPRVEKYVEWDEAKKKLPALLTYPSMSQNFSVFCPRFRDENVFRKRF